MSSLKRSSKSQAHDIRVCEWTVVFHTMLPCYTVTSWILSFCASLHDDFIAWYPVVVNSVMTLLMEVSMNSSGRVDWWFRMSLLVLLNQSCTAYKREVPQQQHQIICCPVNINTGSSTINYKFNMNKLLCIAVVLAGKQSCIPLLNCIAL